MTTKVDGESLFMASLSIRKLDDETVAHLRVRAARHGVSMEEEVRRILRQAVATPERLGDLAVRLFSPAWDGGELELPDRETPDPMELP
jgi:plasmid stability protein